MKKVCHFEFLTIRLRSKNRNYFYFLVFYFISKVNNDTWDGIVDMDVYEAGSINILVVNKHKGIACGRTV